MQRQMVTTCAVCAQEAAPAAAFCSRCGSRLARAGREGHRGDRETVVVPPSETFVPPAGGWQGQSGAQATEGAVPRQARLASLLDRLDAEDAGTWESSAPGSALAPEQTQPWPGSGRAPAHPSRQRAQRQWDDQRQPDDEGQLSDDAQQWDDVPAAQEQREWGAPQRPRRSHRLLVVILALLVATAALVAGVGLLLVHGLPGHGSPTTSATGSSPSPAAPSAAASASAGAGSAAGSLDGEVTATAPRTSPDGTDGSGSTTSYAASQMLDGDPETAWRMDGDGAGSTLTFTLDAPHAITHLGLIDGYAKVDPSTGTDRYTQERRITHVTWIVGGHSYPQALVDGTRTLQTITVPSTTATTVRLHIDATTAPGQAGFDKTAVSDVLIGD